MYIERIVNKENTNLDEVFEWLKGRLEYYADNIEFDYNRISNNNYLCFYRHYKQKEKKELQTEYIFNFKDLMLSSDKNVRYSNKFQGKYEVEFELISFKGNNIEFIEYSTGFLGIINKKKSLVSSIYMNFAHISDNLNQEIIEAVNYLIHQHGGGRDLAL